MRQGACTVQEIDLSTSLQAYHGIPLGVAVWQLRHPEDLRSFHFVGTNPAFEKELGVSLAFAIGKPITECFPKLLETPLPEHYRRVALSGKPETFGELTYRDSRIPEGVFWIECFPLPERCVGVAFKNITERERLAQGQRRALRLLHRVTLFLNNAPSTLSAAQYCVDEVCTEIGWPVGRFFLSDPASPSRFLQNPVWHLRDLHRFAAFRKATELYELDLSNKLALEYRVMQGQRAGLNRSVGFSVVENGCLHGVLEFSSEHPAPLDEHLFRAISNIGYQLGRVFGRENIPSRQSRVPVPIGLSLPSPRTNRLVFGNRVLSEKVESLGVATRTSQVNATLSHALVEEALQLRQRVADLMRTLGVRSTVESLGVPTRTSRDNATLSSLLADCSCVTCAANPARALLASPCLPLLK
jgi:hypothetical protein